jgi:hypothetical protein
MIGSLSDSDIKGRLLAMDLSELRVDDQLRQASLRWPAFRVIWRWGMVVACARSKRDRRAFAGFPARNPPRFL